MSFSLNSSTIIIEAEQLNLLADFKADLMYKFISDEAFATLK